MQDHGTTGNAEVAVGVIGPQDLVERLILAERQPDAANAARWRLVGASYRDEHEAVRRAVSVQQDVDAILFTGPLPYDIVDAADVLEVPATYVPLDGASLFATMIRASRARGIDLARISIDSLSQADVDTAYEEITIATKQVRVREYAGPRSAASFADWHAKLFRDGRTEAAFTTVYSVAQELNSIGVPAFRVLPAAASLRVGLSTAALIGSHNRLEQAQIVVAIVGLPERLGSSGPDAYWQHELRPAVHQVLLREARAMGATVLPRGDRSYFIAATVGSLEAATDGLRTAPFIAAVNEAIGISVAVGIGLAATAREAEGNANRALESAWANDDAHCCLLRSDGSMLTLPSTGRRPAEAPSPGSSKSEQTVRRLLEGIPGGGAGEEPLVVDAEQAAQLLNVSVRTARRALGQLVDEGRAWPLPPPAQAGRGRPRQLYRLVVD